MDFNLLCSTFTNQQVVLAAHIIDNVKGEFITVNAEHIFEGIAPDFPLVPGDIVYVPQSKLGDWNDVVAAISPSFALVTDSLQPFVQLKFLTEN